MTASEPSTGLSNAELIRRVFAALNRQDIAALRPLWTADTVERFPDQTCRGADELAEYFRVKFAAIPDWHMEVIAIAEQGDDVFVQWRLTGTHDGRLMGVAPTGKKLTIDGLDHFVVRDGLIVSNFVVFDQMAFARQFGMLPPDGSAPDKALKTMFNARTRIVRRLKRRT